MYLVKQSTNMAFNRRGERRHCKPVFIQAMHKNNQSPA